MVHTQTELITPQRAVDLLATSIGNRNIRRIMVNRFAEDMATGKWVLNGEPIIVSNTGRLLEGHHRLNACIQANTSFSSLVCYGIPDAAFGTINTGGVRTPGDIFQIAGIANSNNVSAVVTRVLQYEHSVGRSGVNHFNVPFALTKNNLLDRYYTDTEGFDEAVRLSQVLYNALKGVLPSPAGAMHYLFNSVDSVAAHEFMEMLTTGANLSVNHPVLVLRNIWQSRKAVKRAANTEEMMVITCHAWNAFRQGRSVKFLRHNSEHNVPDYK